MSFFSIKRNKSTRLTVSEFQNLLIKVDHIRNQSENLALCLDNTNGDYLGVKNATLNLFPDSTVALPAYYSTLKLSDAQLQSFINHLQSKPFKQIIYSGFPNSLNPFVKQLSTYSTQKIIFHLILFVYSYNQSLPWYY